MVQGVVGGVPLLGLGQAQPTAVRRLLLKWGTSMVAAKGGFRETIGRCKYDTGTRI